MVPAVAGLKKQGANNGASLSFLISTPETGVDSIALTYALLGPFFAVVRPLAAFCSAIAAGFAENLLGQSYAQTSSCSSSLGQINETKGCRSYRPQSPDYSSPSGLVTGFRFAFNDLIADLAVWFLIGILLAGSITAVVPDSFFSDLMEPGLLSYCGMLAASIPLYVCATMSTPLAAALIAKGISPGTALVLLLAGPATNTATISLVAKIFGRRPLIVYLVSIVVCSILFAFVTDAFSVSVMKSVPAIAWQESGGIVPEWAEFVAGAVLALLMIRAALMHGMTGLLKKAFSPVHFPLVAETQVDSAALKSTGST